MILYGIAIIALLKSGRLEILEIWWKLILENDDHWVTTTNCKL